MVARATAEQRGLPPKVQPCGHDVRSNTVLLVRVEGARAAIATLHFVEDQQDTLLVAEPPHALEVGVHRGIHTALALHGLEDDGAGAGGDGLLQRAKIVELHMHHIGQHGFKAGVILGLAGESHGGHGAAVDGVMRGDNLRL
jgi:hypothetical protein